jgi:RNA polymerase sigma factor (sigma-70 family)
VGEPELVAQVEAARSGDRDAFGVLVTRFEAMAVSCAYARLRDADLARDVAQEAFLDAFLHLDQLRECEAFPGWLRRVVLKHCDRERRAPRRRVVVEAGERETPASAPDAADALEEAERDRRLRAAVESLPPAERTIVALHYFAGEPLEQLSAFLELPVTTLKKRLHTARRRLEQRSISMSEITPGLPASPALPLAERVRLFLALRAGDCSAVSALLDTSPSLVDATEDWSLDEALDRGLPAPTRATPLIRAAERGDLAMLDVLLDHGARLDGSCGCFTGESALFAALAAGREAAAARLLVRGADPDASSYRRVTPLHVAAIRGISGIVPLLLAHGADPSRRDASGRTAADWALQKGYSEIAAALGASAPCDDAGGAHSRSAETTSVPLLATGIKVLDLLSPLVPGDLVRVVGGMGVGRNVLLSEISRALARRHGGRSLYAGWEREAWQAAELEELVAETGIADCVELLRSPPDASEPERRSLAERALARAHALRLTTRGPVLLVLFEELGRAVDVESLYTRLRRAERADDGHVSEAPPLTVCLVAPLERRLEPHEGATPLPLCRPFDAMLRLDPALAARMHWPAVDPVSTRSRNLRPEIVGERHCVVAREARALLTRARELDPTAGARPLEVFAGAERALVARARSLQAHLAQPFHVAESFTALPGQSIEVSETIEAVSQLLAGYSSTSSISESSPGTPIRSGNP